MKYIFYFAVAIMFIDLIGFTAWATSGQKPQDNFHAGIILETLIAKL